MSLHEEGLHLNQSPSYLRPICTGYSPLTPPTSPPPFFLERAFFVLCCCSEWCGAGLGGWGGNWAVSWPPIGSSSPLTPRYARNVLPFFAQSQPARFSGWDKTREKRQELGRVGVEVEGLPATKNPPTFKIIRWGFVQISQMGTSLTRGEEFNFSHWWISSSEWRGSCFSSSSLSDNSGPRLWKPAVQFGRGPSLLRSTWRLTGFYSHKQSHVQF